MLLFAEGLLWTLCCAGVGSVPGTTPATGVFRTFVVQKPAQPAAPEASDLLRSAQAAAAAPPPSRGRLHAVVGVGYVQRADWGVEATVSGTIGRLSIQADSLFTFGPEGTLVDRGTIWLQHDDHGWFAEAGDLFSDLRGPSTGARVSWSVNGRWRPSLAIYGPPRRSQTNDTVLAYRDRYEMGPVTIDGEIATDASHFVRGRFAPGGRFAIESSYRRTRIAGDAKDAGLQANLRIWRGLMVTGGIFQTRRPGERNTWNTVGIRLPVHRSIGVTLERTFSITGATRSAASAVMIDAHANQFLFLQRYEWGDTRARQGGFSSFQREQLQSMASFTAGPRLNVALRVATQWQPTGPSHNWLEAQATMRVTRKTQVQITVPIPQALDADRVRVVLEQGLPRQFSLLAEYGRPSAYQTIHYSAEPPRFRLMLRRGFDIATPAAGGRVGGVVLDYVGRPVAGARVRLGSYSADTDEAGRYAFAHMPAGEFELALDPEFLPADYAWDGRSRRLAIKSSSRLVIDLVVAPLNAIHGRVYADRNGNTRFDAGEGIAGAVVRLGDRVTATNAEGGYDFYNLLPGIHTIELETGKLPAGFEAGDRTRSTVALRDDRPANGVDFTVSAKSKPVIWRSNK